LIPVYVRMIAALSTIAGTVGFAPPELSRTPKAPKPQIISYTLKITPGDSLPIEVTMRVSGAPASLRVAMAVQPEYNDRYWRYVRDLRADAGGVQLEVKQERDNAWRVSTLRGEAVVHYRLKLPPDNPINRPAWHTMVRADGASLNSMDTFIYLPDFANTPVEVRLETPWGLPTSALSGGTTVLGAPNAATLLDSPILFGSLRFWRFNIGGVEHAIAYWPLPNATPFDTAKFVDAISRVAGAAAAVFGSPPYSRYTFLLQDGARGGLEHANSVTIGMPSSDLARDPRAYLAQLAHEFFHTWNLVRLYPEGRGALSDRDPEHTTGLWLSEGVTMYYADALLHRAGFPEHGKSRADLLAEELESYYGNPGNFVISPEVASARAVDTTGINGDYNVSYYVQGRLIGTALDLIIRDSTNGRRGLDDLMRALYSGYAMKRGFTSADVERVASETCSCNLHSFFGEYVRSARPLDFSRYLRSVGLRVVVDTIPAADSAGARLPDTRIWAYPPRVGGRMRVMMEDPSSVWGKAGLHTGDVLVAFNGAPIDSFPDFRRAFRTVKLNDLVPVSIIRSGTPAIVNVRVTSYDRVRVRITEAPDATAAQRERRRLWLSASPTG
jgi:predicted metalloprotease with PDZ domain